MHTPPEENHPRAAGDEIPLATSPATSSTPPGNDLPEEEYEDEPPGATLGSLRVRRSWLIWSVVQLGLIAVLGTTGFFLREGAVATTHGLGLPLAVLWTFLPLAALCQLLAVIFIGLVQTQETLAERRRCAWIANLQLASVMLWIVGRAWLGVVWTSGDIP